MITDSINSKNAAVKSVIILGRMVHRGRLGGVYPDDHEEANQRVMGGRGQRLRGLVAKDFRPKSRVDEVEELFAATSPLEVVM